MRGLKDIWWKSEEMPDEVLKLVKKKVERRTNMLDKRCNACPSIEIGRNEKTD
jgi:hypothetical protein